jgi:predicted nucleic acid-binding protein
VSVVVVADASVLLKWMLPPARGERHVDEALDLMSRVRDGQVSLIEPPHWLAEVGAVLARLSPATVEEDVVWLEALRLPVHASATVYRRSAALACQYGQHMFDTLYHAVALERPGAILVTADERYHRAAAGEGAILLISEWGSFLAAGNLC